MIVEAVEQTLAGSGLSECVVLVAASGGIDSTVLLHALWEAGPKRGVRIAVGHVHHGLRGEDADADAEAVRRHAEHLDVPFMVEHADPGALRSGRSSRERPTLQEAARALRYAALRRMAAAAGAGHIATAHNLDDQAETVLMRLLRGAGPDGLGGIPERSADGVVVRPLLGVSRSDIEAFARARRLFWREDVSNECDRYTRNRLRHHWLPGLAREFNPQLLRAIGRLAEAHRRDAEWLEGIVDDGMDGVVFETGGHTVAIHADRFAELPEALARRVARRLLARFGVGRDITRTHLLRTVAFLRSHGRRESGRSLELPGGLRIVAEHDRFTVRRIVHNTEGARSSPSRD